MPKKQDEDDVMENETAIPEPPNGTPVEVSRQAWRVAWSASNAAAGYHASIINHLIKHENKIVGELTQMRADFGRDFASFRSTLLASLHAVGIRIDLSPSGEHSRVAIVEAEPGRERVASSHDLEAGLEEVGDRIEEHFDERLRDLRMPGPIPSDRVREMLSQERSHVEYEQRIMRLELEKKQIELTNASETQRLKDQRTELAEANSRWLRVAFMIAGGVVTVLAALLIWALTRHAPSVGDLRSLGARPESIA
jgi:hypothetical protein